MKNFSLKAMALTLFASGSFLAASVNADPVKIQADVQSGGSWVEVTQNGFPVKNAIINGDYITGDDGRVFISQKQPFNKNIYLVIETPSGETLNKSFFLRQG